MKSKAESRKNSYFLRRRRRKSTRDELREKARKHVKARFNSTANAKTILTAIQGELWREYKRREHSAMSALGKKGRKVASRRKPLAAVP